MLFASVRRATSVPIFVPLVNVDGSALTSEILEPAPATPVAVNDVVRLPAVAVSVFVPAELASVHVPAVALPLEFVVVVAPAIDPPPLLIANVTLTPGTAFPDASVTSTDGGTLTAVATVALWLFPALTAIAEAAPAPRVITFDVAAASAGALNASARGPALPVMTRFVKEALPAEFVACRSVPLSAGLPDERDAVTFTPAVDTGFAPASTS